MHFVFIFFMKMHGCLGRWDGNLPVMSRKRALRAAPFQAVWYSCFAKGDPRFRQRRSAPPNDRA
jgi:hypothetical protein